MLAPIVRVLGILGTSRCGSTVFASALGTVDGYVNIGETRVMWAGVVKARPCSCGTPVGDCGFWRQVFAAADVDPRAMYLTRVDSNAYRCNLMRLYEAIAAITGAQTIVDSSKDPDYFKSVLAIDGADVRFVHMIRDLRGVLASSVRGWRGRGIVQPPNPSLRRCARAAMGWQRRNFKAQRLTRARQSQRVSYEDFVNDPAAIVSQVVGHPVSGQFVVGNSHVAAGNPSRMESGVIELRHDDAWQAFTITRQLTLYLLGLPWTALLGYPPLKHPRRAATAAGSLGP
jgi:sulfotransferase family protein